MATREKSDQRRDYLCANEFRKPYGMQSNSLHRLVGCGHEADTICRYGLSAAKAASAPIKDKLVVAMPSPRERIQPFNQVEPEAKAPYLNVFLSTPNFLSRPVSGSLQRQVRLSNLFHRLPLC